MKNSPLTWTILGAIALAGLTWLPSASRAQEKPAPDPARYKAAISQDDLMYWHDRAFGRAKLALEQMEWEEAQMHALLLAELANVNTTQRPEENYRKLAGELREGALELAKAAKKKEAEAGKRIYERLDKTCTACHDAYED